MLKIKEYYDKKIKEFGATPLGVDWNSIDSQQLRFEQLSKIFFKNNNFSVNDLGCGYGAYLKYLESEYYVNFAYNGYDLSAEMIHEAKRANPLKETSEFVQISSASEISVSDYTVASGIFNVRVDLSEERWEEYIIETLLNLDKKSTRGFSFNILTSYSDKEYMKDNLYYADPFFYFDFCKRNFSRNVALLHDYDLYEFTILVRKI